jgi:hypothetical protein
VNEAASNIDPNAVEEWLRITNQPYAADVDAGATGYASALEMAAGSSSSSYTTPTIGYVTSAPVYGHRTFVFGGKYHGRYSPWGYDWYGWRVIHSPFVHVRAGPVFISTRAFGPHYIVRRGHDSWHPNWRDGRFTDPGFTRGRDGWRTSSPRSWDRGRSGDRSGHWSRSGSSGRGGGRSGRR